MNEQFYINLLEWVSIESYRLAVAGNWIDDRGNVVARDTAHLVQVFRDKKRAPEPEDEQVKTVKKIRTPYKPRDYNGGNAGRKPLPNTLDRYKLVKARKLSECGCCRKAIQVGYMKWSTHINDLCVKCMSVWEESGVVLEQLPWYVKKSIN